MRFWAQTASRIWKATCYLFLIVFSSIVGAQLGTGVGIAVGAMTGEPSWAAHGRCVGWTIFVLGAAVGAPFGFVYFYPDEPRQRDSGRNQPAPQLAKRKITAPVVQRTERGIKAMLLAPLLGAFMGLILGGMLGGFLVALYFFVCLSPFGPGGWWPILSLTFESTDDGFTTNDPFIRILWLIFVGTFVILGSIIALWTGVSFGKTRFQVFGSGED